MKTFKYQALLESFFEGNLSEKEKQAFQQQLRTNAELKQEYDVFQATEKVMEVMEMEAFVNSIAGEDKMESTIKPISRNYRIAIAATLLLLISALSLIWYINRNYTNPALAARNFAPASFSYTLGGGDPATTFTEIVGKYNRGEYEDAYLQLKAHLLDHPDDPSSKAHHLLAYISYKTGRFSESAEAFEEFLDGNPVRGRQRAEWNLSLIYLSLGNMEEFNRISSRLMEDQGHPFHRQAEALSHDLGSFLRLLVL